MQDFRRLTILNETKQIANGHIYYTSREGKTVVLKSGVPLQVVATNQLDDTVDSSLAIVGNSIFVRGLTQLYCIE